MLLAGTWGKKGDDVAMRSVLLMIFAVLWAALLVLTGGRFLALLAGANRDSDLIQGLYDVSEFWVEPFFNLFGLSNKAVENTGGVFEPASLIAFMVYLVIGVFIYVIISGAAFARMRHA
jgi:hypothetical protein